jgi:hypothetical protein
LFCRRPLRQQSRRYCALPARLEAHLLERGAGIREPVSTEPADELLRAVRDENAT